MSFRDYLSEADEPSAPVAAPRPGVMNEFHTQLWKIAGDEPGKTTTPEEELDQIESLVKQYRAIIRKLPESSEGFMANYDMRRQSAPSTSPLQESRSRSPWRRFVERFA